MSCLQALSDEQLAAHFNRLYDDLPADRRWDWLALRACRPAHYAKMHAVRQEVRRRLRANGRFLGLVALTDPENSQEFSRTPGNSQESSQQAPEEVQ